MRRLGWGVLAVILAMTACVDAKIRKVRDPSDYTCWTDEDQRAVDRLCGLRFYLSRPYVAVHKPFPVTARTYLVDGVLSEDGCFVRVVGDLAKLDEAGRRALQHASLSADSLDVSTRAVWRADAQANALARAEREVAAARVQAESLEADETVGAAEDPASPPPPVEAEPD